MYISKIQISNYRCFRDITINFNNGINVIIGHNNAGKSNLIKAISIFFDSAVKKQLDIDDFNKYLSLEELKSEPPKISIILTISQSDNENLMSDDLVTVSNWLTKLQNPYEAKLTYEYFLPTKEFDKYINAVKNLDKLEDIWSLINDEFLRLYTYKIWGGEPINQVVADSESLQKFDFQFLNAVRDVERDMFTGKNAMLKSVLDFFIDYEIKANVNLSDDERKSQIKAKKYDFSNDAKVLLDKLQERMKAGKQQILSYSKEIGASFDKSNPNFDGSISDIELYSALKLIVEYETGIKIPVSNNGLGYNNLIFISLLLSKMQVNSDGEYLGSNAKVFPVLSIEEPEAHLHPSMQFQFLKFIKKNISENRVRQVFITTHSTHIASSILLDEMICLYKKDNEAYVSYPGKVFSDDDEGKKSKKYVQRFLDATKSNMLFADKIILVEGIAEQLLLSIFADYIGVSLEENHVAVINIGGRYFEHFLKLFDSKRDNTINRKVACITDIDPERKVFDGKYGKAYPFEYGVDIKNYDYKQNTYLKNYETYAHPNIAAFTQNKKYGKTFEYELILSNPCLQLMITDSMDNKDELKMLMKLYKENKDIDEFKKELRKSKENDRICDSVDKVIESWNNSDIKKAIIAARYLNSVGKGENALELAYVLEENLKKKETAEYEIFNVPKYIQEAIEWVCK
ncbi:AAA family ATPase [Clostridium beijerinckii]|uniref:AAA family ATPase n=1 Tax=Clostridium beijerinckii TaxID=1520 RepID=UPI00232C31D6|nr:AAA family ATPase [Clostridium beijerinckii]